MTGWGTAMALDVSVGLVVLGLGLLACRRPADRRTGLLIVAVGIAWLLGDVTPAATFLNRGPLTHVVLGYPSGRLTLDSRAGGGHRLVRRRGRAGPRPC